MKIKIVNKKYSELPDNILAIGYNIYSNIEHVTIDNIYEVYAVSVWRSTVSYCIINDLSMPYWVLYLFCELQEKSIPVGWECNVIDDELLMIIGPPFISESEEAYTKFVERDPEQEEKFWEGVKRELK